MEMNPFEVRDDESRDKGWTRDHLTVMLMLMSCWNTVSAMARKICRAAKRADPDHEDLLQELLVSIWKPSIIAKLAGFTPKRMLGYCFSVMNYFNMRSLMKNGDVVSLPDAEQLADRMSSRYAISTEALAESIYKKMAEFLTADELNLIRMKFEYGMTSAEIGEELGVTAQAARARLHRTLMTVREHEDVLMEVM